MNKTWVTPGGVPPENKHQSLTQGIGQLPIRKTGDTPEPI